MKLYQLWHFNHGDGYGSSDEHTLIGVFSDRNKAYWAYESVKGTPATWSEKHLKYPGPMNAGEWKCYDMPDEYFEIIECQLDEVQS